MFRYRLNSLLAMLCLMLAVSASLAQAVVVAAKHAPHDAAVVSVVLDHGHVHEADLPDHDPADHTHDVAHDAGISAVPMVSWSRTWDRDGTRKGVAAVAFGHERPPRSAVLT